MTDEQIKQNAEEYANEHMVRTDGGGGWEEEYDYEEQKAAYLAGAHSRDEEIKELEKKVSANETVIVTAKATISTQEEIIKQLSNPWISVKDRLIEDNKTVLVWFGGYYTVAVLRDNEWITTAPNGEEWCVGGVTHWMPIPELKKKDKN